MSPYIICIGCKMLHLFSIYSSARCCTLYDDSAAKIRRKPEITKYFSLFRYISSEIKQN